jgi:acyl dehydratase
MQSYALVSGDDNPLHFNSALAAKAGLTAPPVHGMLMLSCCEPAILAWRQDVMIAKLSAKFLLPVLTGQSIAISGRVLRADFEEQPQMLLRLLARIVSNTPLAQPNRDLAILAEATLLYRRQD